MDIRFLVMGNRGNLSRDQVEASLLPLKQALNREQVTTLNVIKINASIVCIARQDTFERLFQTRVLGTDATNWRLEKPVVIPNHLARMGLEHVALDQIRTINELCDD